MRLPHGAGFTATFLLHTKSDTFGASSLSRIVDTEVSFSSPSLMFDLWLKSVNTLLEDAILLTIELVMELKMFANFSCLGGRYVCH